MPALILRQLKVNERIKIACIVALTLCACLLLLECQGLVRDVRLSVRMSDSVLGNVNEASLETAQIAISLKGATDEETRRLAATIDEARKDGRASRATLDSFRQVLIDFHQQVVPSVTKTIADIDDATLALKPTFDNAAKATSSAATLLSDPSISLALHNLEDLTAHANQSTEHLEAVTAAGERTALYYEKRLTTPQSFLKTLVQAVLQLGSQARILLAK